MIKDEAWQARRRVNQIGRHAGGIIALVVVVGLAAIFVFPLFWMISTSLKLPSQVFAQPTVWWPPHPAWSNYVRALQAFPFLRYFLNSVIVSVATTVGTVVTSSLVAYGFSRVRFPGRDILFVLVLATLMLPSWVTLVPLYIMFNTIGWVNTYLPLVLPPALSTAFSIFLLRQFFRRLPQDLIDAALVDGASHLRVFLRIALPLARPAVAVVALFAFVDSWTDYINPLVYLSNQKLYTLQLGLFNYFGPHDVDWPGLMVASLLVMTPMVVVFLVTQRSLIQGITFTGIRG